MTIAFTNANRQIQHIAASGAGTEADPFIKTVSLPNPELTPTLTTAILGGTIAAGAVAISIANIGSANAIVLGATLPPGAAIDWAPHSGTIGAITYDATGTSLLIQELR